MTPLYVLIVLVSGTPQITTYQTDAQACLAYQANPGSFVYSVTGNPKNPTITKGDCAVVQQFVVPKK